jgi:hypothetical protein
MGFQILTPLRSEECASAVRRAIPMAQISSRVGSVTVRLGRHRVKLIMEDHKQTQAAYGAVRSKVKIYSAEPDENIISLEESMEQDVSLAIAIRSIISALKPVESQG